MSDEFMQNNASNVEPQTQSQPQQPYQAQPVYQTNQTTQPQGSYQQQYQQNYGQQQYQNYGQPQNGRGLAIASMVLGIVSCVFCWVWYIVIPAGVVGLILGIVFKKKGGQSGMATAGVICSIVGLALVVLLYVLVFAGLFATIGWLGDYGYYY